MIKKKKQIYHLLSSFRYETLVFFFIKKTFKSYKNMHISKDDHIEWRKIHNVISAL